MYWCTADIGWVTGHSYVVYGPLQNGATVMMYEGAPNWPENDRFWKIIDAHKVTIFYTAPTAIRAFTKWGDEWVAQAFAGVAAAAGDGGRADQSRGVDVVSPRDRQGALPDCRYLLADGDGRDHDRADSGGGARPSRGRRRDRSLELCLKWLQKKAKPVPDGQGGLLVIRKPWPSMARTIYGDPERYRSRPTGARFPAATSPATARGAMRMATSG